MRSTLMILIVAMLAAGCVGEDDPPLETAANAPVDETGASPAIHGESPSGTDAPSETPRPEPGLVESPVAFEHSVGTGFVVCAPNLPSGCVGEYVAPGDSFVQLPFEGVLAELDLVLTWTAQTPITQTLGAVVAYGHETCGEDCITVVDAIFVEGTSPLTVSTGDLASVGADIVYFSVYEPRPDVPAGYRVDVEQAVDVEGTIRALVDADPSAT